MASVLQNKKSIIISSRVSYSQKFFIKLLLNAEIPNYRFLEFCLYSLPLVKYFAKKT